MYKLLIIDDEIAVRIAVKNIIDWTAFGVCQILEADNGYVGMELINREYPDIVLVDIKMPGMNGLAFIETAKKVWSSAVYVIVSGYGDYDFTKRAIGLQVFDYLLKPINRKELSELVGRIVQQLQTNWDKARSEAEQQIVDNITAPLIKEKVYSLLIDGGDNLPPIIKAYEQLVKKDSSEQYYGAACLYVVNWSRVVQERFRNDHFSFFYAVTNVINEMCGELGLGYSFKSGKKDHEIIIVLELDELPSQSRIISEMKQITDKLIELFGVYPILGIGSMYNELNDIKQSYLEAQQIVNQANLMKRMDTVYWEVEKRADNDPVSLLDVKELLFRAFESDSIAYAQAIIDEYIGKIVEYGYFNITDVRKAAQEFSIIIKKIHSEFALQLAGSFDRDCLTIEDLTVYMSDTVSASVQRIHTVMQSNGKDSANRIKAYIETNYHHEISLRLLSERFYLSKSYMIKMFKEEFGFGIYEYVLTLRMERAAMLLKETHIPVQKIADEVGYNDKAYFSKAFKTYYGVIPTEYRKRQTGGIEM
jgi:two-component system response regulator YesN